MLEKQLDGGRGTILLVCCSLVFFFVSVVSPPPLQDEVDSVTPQIARTMIESGDWVTPRLDGVVYLEKPALRFWVVAVSFLVFGVHDWAARIPLALSAIALCWLVRSMGIWAFSPYGEEAGENGCRKAIRTGNLAGVILATSIGLFLFTRILIPDVILTLTTALAMWSFVRGLDQEERRWRMWSALMAASMGLGFMLKGLIAFAFPVGAGFVYLLLTRQLRSRETWRRLTPITGVLIILLICLPWLVLAVLRNPPYLDFTMKSEPGHYHGFFWYFFLNEHLFRYLNMRYPRDYDTVPRPLFWLYHFLWLFPWSVWFPFIARLNFKPIDRAGRVRLFCLCWIGFILLFFTFSTTQEYYSMPCYPAFALLLGSAMNEDSPRFKWAAGTAGVLALLAAAACAIILWLTRDYIATGDIADALQRNVSTLSLGKAENITMRSFAWLRLPLITALCAFLIGAAGVWYRAGRYTVIALALMMLLFFNAARVAMITLSPQLGSRLLADALIVAPPGELIVADHYYSFSSVFFYSNWRALLLNGRYFNLEYGSFAPNAPHVFINDQDLLALWPKSERRYLLAGSSAIPRLRALLGGSNLHIVREAGGKFLLTNQWLSGCETLK